MKRYIVCNTSWMLRYEGVRGDKAYGGGEYVKKHGHGSESYNFKNVGGKYYGYASPHGETINLERLGASPESQSLSGVTIVWTAPRPNFRQVVVGWYRNATVYRHPRNHPRYHFVSARKADSKLLRADERTLKVPRGKGAMGQSNVWYPDTTKGRRFIDQVKRLMTGKVPAQEPRGRSGRAWQQDLKTRLRIERQAIELVVRHFEKQRYKVSDVQKDNKGWDLEAARGGWLYRLEVKGLSAAFDGIELTPNEYAAMVRHKDSFCLCVVSGLERQKRVRTIIYHYSPEEDGWMSEDGSSLSIETRKVISARCSPIS